MTPPNTSLAGPRLRRTRVLAGFLIAATWIGGSFFLLATGAEATPQAIVLPEQANTLLFNDRFALGSRPLFAKGDFDGNGIDDIAVLAPGKLVSEVYLFLGGPSLINGTFSGTAAYRFSMAGLGGVSLDPLVPPTVAMGDLNGDGKSDLAIGCPQEKRVLVLFGRTSSIPQQVMEEKDMGLIVRGPADATTFGASLAIGRFLRPSKNGGVEDLAISSYDPLGYSLELSTVYIVMGNASWGSPPAELDCESAVQIVSTNTLFGRQLLSLKMGEDGSAALAVEYEANNFGRVIIYQSLKEWPATGWDRIRATIVGTAENPIRLGIVVDYTRDGTDDLMLLSPGGSHDSFLFPWPSPDSINDGSFLPPDQGLRLSQEAFPTEGIIHAASGDFDGDGGDDLVFGGPDHPAHVLLSGDLGTPWPASPFASLQLVSTAPYLALGQADLDGDGRADIHSFHKSSSTDSFPIITDHGFLAILKGFRPLRNPSLRITGGVGALRRYLALSVEGDPVDMIVSGDIADADRDAWIPYATTREITWASGAGNRRVRTQFRNSSGKTSDWAEAFELLPEKEIGVRVLTNKIRPGGEGAWEITLQSPAHLTARILTSRGARVRLLLDVDRAAGVWPVRWNGETDKGRSAAPGVYFLEVAVDDTVTRTRLLITRD